MMIKTILFDLDNTLVIFDEGAFYLRFMDHILPFFKDQMPEKQFRNRLLSTIGRLRNNDGDVTNKTFFMDQFCRGITDQREAFWQRFISFYQTEYANISVEATRPRDMERVLDQLGQWGLRLVVATNPIFPEIAPRVRMNWVGLDMKRFDLLTHLENMSYVKPRPEYYQQICSMINATPEECLMVGNDSLNDMVAGVIGMHTFLTTEAIPLEYRLKGGESVARKNHPADFSGPLAELIPTVARLNGG